jgi:hypothetical protein
MRVCLPVPRGAPGCAELHAVSEMGTWVCCHSGMLFVQVRSCAQRVIDNVNESFKNEKESLEASCQQFFTQMQTLASHSEMGPHLNRHLQAAPSAQQPR